MNHSFLKNSLLLVFLIISSGLVAQHIVSDRPGIGDGASTVPKNRFQVEIGFEMARFEPNGRYTFNINTLPIALLRYGIGNKIELRLTQAYFFTDSPKLWGDFKQNGLSNTSLGSKFKISENTIKGISNSILLEFAIPTGSEKVVSDKYALGLRYIFSWDFSERGNLTSNIGGIWFEEQAISLVYSFAMGYTINDKLGIFVEPYGDIFQLEEFNIAIDSGLTFLLNSKMQMDFSAGKGLNNDFYFFGFGFSWLIG